MRSEMTNISTIETQVVSSRASLPFTGTDVFAASPWTYVVNCPATKRHAASTRPPGATP